MNTQTFLNNLSANQNKELIFEYASGEFVGANYHITEVKNTTYDTVDCGGSTNYWQETIVQLWENPKEIGKRSYMKASKALEIFNRVDQIKPLLKETTIKIEYGNDSFHTANLLIEDILENDSNIIVKLHKDETLCKASAECCDPSAEKKETSSAVKCC